MDIQENMVAIDKKELGRLKKAKKIRRIFHFPMLWVVLIIYSLVGISFILYGIFSMPDCWFKKYIIENPAVGATLYLVIGVLITLLYVAILNKASSMEKKFGEYLCSIDISSDAVLLIGEKYGFDGAFEVALQKRLRELGISEIPRKCTDGREILRLPTKEDLEVSHKQDKLIEYILEIQSMAQSALFYVKDEYDRERFERLRDISAEMMALKTELPLETVKTLFCSDYGYQTPKVDTRAAIFQDDKILLVHEKNGTWSMPGGWCEYNMSPVENTIKETKEEAGKDIQVKSIISVQNRDNHNVPPYAYAIVKIFYLCEETGGNFEKNHETTEIAYFAENELPDMAPEKCNEEQVHMCFEAYHSKNWVTQFD